LFSTDDGQLIIRHTLILLASRFLFPPCLIVLQGTGHGHVYLTEEGQLIIRHETWSFLGRKPDFIVEDYLTLEEGGKVIVDRMCACNCKTGQRAEQIQVVRLVSRPGQA
jgi:hypothetical protein